MRRDGKAELGRRSVEIDRAACTARAARRRAARRPRVRRRCARASARSARGSDRPSARRPRGRSFPRSPRSAQAVRGRAAEAAVADRRDAGAQAVERPEARDRLHVLAARSALALDVQADPVGEPEPVSEAGVDVVLEVRVGVDEAREDHRLVVVHVARRARPRVPTAAMQSVVDRDRAVSNRRSLDRDHPVGGDDAHDSSASAKSSSQPRFQRRSMKTESQIDISNRMRSGMRLERERDRVDGRQQDREHEQRDVARCAGSRAAVGGQDAKAHEREDEDRHEERQARRRAASIAANE